MRKLVLSAVVLGIAATPGIPGAADEAKVPLDLYVMSQCPWGVKAEDAIFPAVKSLDPFVDFHLYFIAEVQPGADSQPASQRFQSMHGAPEVAENLRQVCAQKHFPARYLEYILERNHNIMDPNWQAAATKVGIAPEVIEQCAGGAEGAALLSENLKAHKARQATASPTIDISGTPYTGPRGLRSISLALCEALKAKGVRLPGACAKAAALPSDPVPSASGCGAAPAGAAAGGCGAPAAGGCAGGCGGGCGAAGAVRAGLPSSDLAFDIRVVADTDCTVCPPKFVDVLKQAYPAARFTTIPAGSKDGKAIITRVGATRLPLYLLDPAVAQTATFQQLKGWYVQVGDGYLVRPEAAKPDVHLARKRLRRHLDLFVLSLSQESANASVELLRWFQETKAKDLTFSLHFLVQEAAQEPSHPSSPESPRGPVRAASVTEIGTSTPGPLISAGGEAEIQESLRQVCLFQHAPLGDLFTYLTCRSQNLPNPKRADVCLVMGEVVKRCIEGPEGERLLREDAKLVRELGIAKAPVLLWENQYGPVEFNEVGSLEPLVSERR